MHFPKTLLLSALLTALPTLANLSFKEKHTEGPHTIFHVGGTFDVIAYAINESPTRMSPHVTLNLRDVDTDALIVNVQPNQTYTTGPYTDDPVAPEGGWKEYTLTFTIPPTLPPPSKLYDPVTKMESGSGTAGRYTLEAQWRKFVNDVDVGPMSDYWTIFVVLTTPTSPPTVVPNNASGAGGVGNGTVSGTGNSTMTMTVTQTSGVFATSKASTTPGANSTGAAVNIGVGKGVVVLVGIALISLSFVI